MNLIQILLPAIEHVHLLGYWIAFFAALLETVIGVGLFVPGSTIILFMGGFAANGYFDLGDLIWFAVIGALIGDNINYYLGKRFGSTFFEKGFLFVKPKHFKRGEAFFKKHGSKSIFIGRFIPSVKEVIPFIAGTLGMRRTPFILWNLIGAIGWSLLWILPGYYFTQSLELASVWMTRTGFFLLILFVVVALFYILKIILIKKGSELLSFLSSVALSIKGAVVNNKDVQRFTERHKTVFRFLRRRLDTRKFSGLPLSLIILAFLYTLSLFGGVAEDVISSDVIVLVDVRVANLLAIFRSRELVEIFLWITMLGKTTIVLLFTTATITTLLVWNKRHHIIPLLVSIIGAGASTYILKILFHRARPDVAVYVENTFSFPSGHATFAVAFYGFVTYLLIRHTIKWKYKVNALFFGILVIMSLGFSRLFLGVHYVSDVLGGFLIGTMWLIAAISISEFLIFSRKQIVNKRKKQKLIATIGILLVSLLVYGKISNDHVASYSPPILSEQMSLVELPTDLFTEDQLKYTETLSSARQEPLSFIVLARDDEQFLGLFQQAGWKLADDVTLQSVMQIAKSAILKESYATAPMTPDFWNAKVHDFGFEKETDENSVRTRHHARFWNTNFITKDGYTIYVGTASFDTGIKWGVTHQIDPNIDGEREFLFDDLQATGLLISNDKVSFVDAKIGNNFTGDQFFTDGELYLLYLAE